MSRRTRIILVIIGALAITVIGAVMFRIPEMHHIQLPAEVLTTLGGFPITNTMVSAWLSILVLALIFRAATSKMQIIPGRGQSLAEMTIEFVLGLCESIAGRRNGRMFFPICMTIFLFALTSNWMGLLPGYGTVGFFHTESAAHETIDPHEPVIKEGAAAKDAEAKPAATDGVAGGEHAEDTAGEHATFTPLLRSANTDLNTTLALAIISVVATTVFGIRQLGLGGYGAKFFNFRGGPIGLFVGILELISEFARLISFSFRLFGNVFAGEVLLAVITFLVPWVLILPFYGLELFVGFIQALVFAMLTLVFMSLAVTAHDHGGHDEHREAAHH